VVTRISILAALLTLIIPPEPGSAATGSLVPASEVSQEILVQEVSGVAPQKRRAISAPMVVTGPLL
jgi:hypothetical protein